MTRVERRLLGLLFSSALLSACGGGVVNSNKVNATAESAYCANTLTTTNPITVNATANYFYRATNVTTGLSGDPVSRGIAFAEVVVSNSSGAVVQCATTDASGNISFQIEKTAGTYTISVNSRAYNSKIRASVLTDPASNAFYTISKNFTLTGSESSPVSAGALTAYARLTESAQMEGAAFHILYNIYLANEYIRSTVSSTFVAEKVSAYWKAGFNPGSYFGSSDGMSFYITGESQLYILGGSNGNVKTADTDHFDDSVIIHEYGHFLEDRYSNATSPGGSHNGDFIIDPRLAWSEGWANFFQGAVVTNAGGSASRGRFYIDTVGYRLDSVEGGTGYVAIRADLLANASSTSTQDYVSVPGEGTFREMSIARFLYKAITNVSLAFNHLWLAFSETSNGMRSTSNIFSNVGIYNKFLNTRVPSGNLTGWNNLLTEERQNKTTVDYADPLVISTLNSCPKKQLTPVVDTNYASSSDPRSNKLRSNDFYLFHYDGAGGILSLNYTQVSGVTIDLDLYLYNRSHNYQEDYIEAAGQSNGTVAAKSDRSYALDSGAEAINLAGLPIGYYLINVKANTYGKTSAQLNGTAQYSLTLRGSDLCPEN